MIYTDCYRKIKVNIIRMVSSLCKMPINRMLDIRTYTREELIQMYGTNRLDAIKAKLARRGYQYTTSGRGKDFTLTITALPQRFKEFCISELNFSGQTDFEKLKKFLYRFFFDSDFKQQPYSEMERRLIKETGITRQTISKWVKHLYQLNMIHFDMVGGQGDFNYFLNGRNENGDVETKRITNEQYARAWKLYFDALEEGTERNLAFHKMRIVVGGVPQKKGVIEENAFEAKKIDTLKEILQAEKEPDW